MQLRKKQSKVRPYESGQDWSAPISCKPRLLGFGMMVAVSVGYLPSTIPLISLGNELQLHTFVSQTLLCASIVALVALVILSRRGVDALRCFDLIGAIWFIGGTVGYVFVSQQGIQNEIAICCCGTLAGSGGLFVYMSWGRSFARLGLKNALFNVVLSMGLASVLSWLLFLLDATGFVMLFPCLTALGALLSLVDERIEPDNRCDSAGDSSASDQWGGSIATNFRNLRASMAIMTAPFLGLLVFGFASFLVDLGSIAELYNMQVFGSLIGMAFLLLLLLVRFRHPPFPFFYQVLLPFLAICALMARMLAGEGLAQDFVFDVSMHILFGVVVAFSFASLAAIGHADELPIEVIVTIAYGLYCGASWIGMTVSDIVRNFGMQPSDFAITAWVLYFAFQALYPAFLNWTGAYASEMSEERTFSIEENLGVRCEEIADEYGLTPRETEICTYLGRGHSSLYISRTLLIADSTVRTHIKNIYRKLDVSSREELIDLIDTSCNDRQASEL